VDTSLLPDYSQRRKTSALAGDLVSLEAKQPLLATEQQLPEIHNHLQALGALYVIEGSTLGGKIISKMINQQLGLTDGLGLSFFDGYGNDTELMWQRFRQSIDQQVKPADEQIIIQSANDTFLKFSNWFDAHFA
jgi:heme oxygenase